jgi:DNA modification methylase
MTEPLELNRCIFGDALKVLRTLPDGVFDCCVSSPPYYALRTYKGHPKQIGLETTPQAYIRKLVRVFREVRRTLRDDGLLFVVIGDSYAGSPGGFQGKNGARASRTFTARIDQRKGGKGLKPKDLIGVPWMLGLALRADGWWLRADIIHSKPNPMPESVLDRPTRAHDYVLMLAKSHRYFYNEAAMREPAAEPNWTRDYRNRLLKSDGAEPLLRERLPKERLIKGGETRAARDVWTIPSEPYRGEHYATMPSQLARRCILAGSREGGAVLDPFMGSGTCGLVAEALGRRWLGIELEKAYEPLIRERTSQAGLYFDQPAPELTPARPEPEQVDLEVGT